MSDFEYCVAVCDQHNYTDNAKEAIELFGCAMLAWCMIDKKGPEPEILSRQIGSDKWVKLNAAI